MICPHCNGKGKISYTVDGGVKSKQGWGCNQTITYYDKTVYRSCSTCFGCGYAHYVDVVAWCSKCNGTGEMSVPIIHTYPTGRQIPTGQYKNVTCDKCSGSGRETKSELHSGKGSEDNKKEEGCFITTAVCNEFDSLDADIVLNKFRSFRDNWLSSKQNGSALISQYYSEAPQILEKIDLAKYNETMKYIWDTYLSRCLSMIENDENDQALEIYQEMFFYLKKDIGV
ncbi:MAG: hypothetical protein FNT15_04020 [Sulfurovum sp.]|nr:MAG: hypothetical protein FNT15_04020 [Sulfurovum sp.]